MITLCMDTSHRYLTLVLIEDDKVLASYQEECFKKQSESILEQLDKLCASVNLKPTDLGAVCITKGPGSYTGVRIAMTVAKILCTFNHIPLYTMNTLDLYACDQKDCVVLLDARSHRAYFGEYRNGLCVEGPVAIDLDVIKEKITDSSCVMGDASLVRKEESRQDYAKSFLFHKQNWVLEENVHTCVPEYLKDNQEYMVKK